MAGTSGRTLRRLPVPRRARRWPWVACLGFPAAAVVGAVVGRLLYLRWQQARLASLCEGPARPGSAGYGPCPGFHGTATPGLLVGALLGLAVALAVSRMVLAFREPLV